MPKDDIKALFDEAKGHLQKGVRRKTITDGVLSPAAGSAPQPPRPRERQPTPLPAAELESSPDQAVPAGSAPDDGPVSSAFDAREAPTRAARRRPAPVLPAADSVYPHYAAASLPGVTPSVMARADKIPLVRLLIIIAAVSTGVGGAAAAIGAAVVSIITALRPPSNAEIMKRIELLETRVNGDFGLPLEVKTRQDKDEAIEKRIGDHERALKKLKDEMPLKVKPAVVVHR
jgi:hypothetical protein